MTAALPGECIASFLATAIRAILFPGVGGPRTHGGYGAAAAAHLDLGVEVGQLPFAALTVPLYAWAGRRLGAKSGLGVSVAVGIAGLGWLFIRLSGRAGRGTDS